MRLLLSILLALLLALVAATPSNSSSRQLTQAIGSSDVVMVVGLIRPLPPTYPVEAVVDSEPWIRQQDSAEWDGFGHAATPGAQHKGCWTALG